MYAATRQRLGNPLARRQSTERFSLPLIFLALFCRRAHGSVLVDGVLVDGVLVDGVLVDGVLVDGVLVVLP